MVHDVFWFPLLETIMQSVKYIMIRVEQYAFNCRYKTKRKTISISETFFVLNEKEIYSVIGDINTGLLISISQMTMDISHSF